MSIGDWDEGTLARFIEDAIQRDPMVALLRALQGGALQAVAGLVGAGQRVVWNGGLVVVNAGASLNVAHGLGVAPFINVATANRNDLTVCSINVGSPDATNVVLRNTSGVNSNVYWFAAGLRTGA